jgi:hypothetical protein
MNGVDLREIKRALKPLNGPWLPGVLDRQGRLIRQLLDAPAGLTFTDLRAAVADYRDMSKDEAWIAFRIDLWHLGHAGIAIGDAPSENGQRRYVLTSAEALRFAVDTVSRHRRRERRGLRTRLSRTKGLKSTRRTASAGSDRGRRSSFYASIRLRTTRL